MAIHLDRQRPPVKKMGRRQRTGSKSNPRTGVQWANWLDVPGSGGGGGGPDGPGDPHIMSLVPNTAGLSEVDVAVVVNGSNFEADSVIEVNNAPIATTFSSSTQLTATVPLTTAGSFNVTVRNVNDEESNIVVFTVVDDTVQAMSAEGEEESAIPTPTSSWVKADIISWLVNEGGYEEEGLDAYTKTELMELVEGA
jgi:IPT/TIG domain